MHLSPLLALAGLLTVGLLATRLPRFPLSLPHSTSFEVLLAGGAPLVVAGLVLGPGIDLLRRPALDALAPVTALAIGWIGAALGARAEWRVVRRIARSDWVLAGLAAGVTLVAVALSAWLLTRAVPALARAWTPRLPAILTLGAVAAISGPGAVALVARGSARIGLGRYQDAVADYTAAQKADPSLAAPLFGLAEAFRALGQGEKAAALYREFAASNAPDAQPALKEYALQNAQALSPR